MNAEEAMAKVSDLRPIDDVFFEVLAEDKEVCEEILQTLLEDDGIKVLDVVVQGDKRNIYGRSVRLDALCTLGNGSKCNIEVQRSNNDDHIRRARFNASIITVKDSNAGDRFEDILDLYIVYISEFDFLKGGKTIYHVDKVLRETGQIIDDGLHEIFVNTVVDDQSKIADLMSCFEKKDVQNANFPKLTQKVQTLKKTEGGAKAVCKVMEQYEEIARAEGRAEGLAKGKAEGLAKGKAEGRAEGLAEGEKKARVQVVRHLLSKGMSPQEIADMLGFDLPEVEDARNAILPD